MKFSPLPLKGAYLIELERKVDKRGYFARTFCVKKLQEYNLVTKFIQMSTSFNKKKGQIRGMHYQEAPYEETKIVRCTKGAVYDIMVDLRENSPTVNQWYGGILSADNGKIFYIPKGFAHGYKTLENNSELFYMMDEFYMEKYAREIFFQDKYLS
jgi:dTDP-4-dehydrorhamnose 3,5-epimerase